MNKKKAIISITILIIITLLLAGITYAYYRTRVIGNNSTTPSISVTSKKLGVSYEDGEAVLSTNGKIKPGFTATKAFSVVNTGQGPANYSIIIDNVNNEFNKGIRSRGEYYDWKYYLYSGTEVNDNNLIVSGNVTFDNLQYLVKKVTIDAGKTLNYILKVEYLYLEDFDQSDDMTSRFSLRVNIGDEVEELPWDNTSSGTLLYALRNNQPSGTETTTPGQEVSTENEARVVATEDDYNISLMYRGNVTNNYVNYSGMCWRVVRVDGNGNIKVILADENNECNEGYSISNETSALINNNAKQYYSATPAGRVSLDLFRYTKSTIPSTLQTWANRSEKELDVSNLVEDAEWCNDLSYRLIYNEGFEVDDYIFSHYYRNENPSLKCDFTGEENSKSEIYNGFIGIITLDEYLFSGSKGSYPYKAGSNYLVQNASSAYWTMTPASSAGGDFSYMGIIGSTGIPFDAHLNDANYFEESEPLSIRPAIVLKSSVSATYDSNSEYAPGTYQNPYVIG